MNYLDHGPPASNITVSIGKTMTRYPPDALVGEDYFGARLIITTPEAREDLAVILPLSLWRDRRNA